MSEQLNEGDRVVALANQLRFLQVDFADQSDDARRNYLSEEIRRILMGIAPNERQAFLEKLTDHFPTWDENVEASPGPKATQSQFDQNELNDPSFLLTRLIETCKTLPEEKRNQIVDRLAEAGLSKPGTKTEWPAPAVSDAKLKVQLGARDEFQAGRVLELLGQFADFTYKLDQVAWSTWRNIKPNSAIQRPAVLQRTISRFAAGDTAIGTEQVVSELRMLRALTGGLIGTHAQIGRIATQHFKEFFPEEIMLLVGPKGFNREAAYWRKYVELAGEKDSGAPEDAIKTKVGDFAEALIVGR